MKKSVSIAIIGILSMAFIVWLTGCASNPRLANSIGTAAENAVKTGTTIALKKHPELRQDFESAYAELNVLAQADKIDPAAVAAIVQNLPIDALKSDTSQLIISGAEVVVETLAPNSGEVVSAQRYADAKIVINDILIGLRKGIDAAFPPTSWLAKFFHA